MQNYYKLDKLRVTFKDIKDQRLPILAQKVSFTLWGLEKHFQTW